MKTAVLLSCLSAAGLSTSVHAAGELDGLKAHWNFDEGRDWHNMEFPYTHEQKTTRDWVGANDLTVSPEIDAVKDWAPGRQWSGIRLAKPGAHMKTKEPIRTLAGTATVSFWIKTTGKQGGVLGSDKGLEYGVVTPEGKIALKEKGKVVAESGKVINDDQWHHVVIMRKADDGQAVIYIDGVLDGKGEGSKGEIAGDYTRVGKSSDAEDFTGVLDQVHVFEGTVVPKVVEVLKDNFAPKVYEQQYLFSNKKPTVTGSILHLYTFDPDQDKLNVERFEQPKHGKVSYNNNGTFTYTAKPGYMGEDEFFVTISDGKGGFGGALVKMEDESLMPKPPIAKYANFQELTLPGVPGGEAFNGSRTPRIYDYDGDGKLDLVIGGNNKIYLYTNKGTKAKPVWADPVELKTKDGESFDSQFFAFYDYDGDKRADMIVRDKDSGFVVYLNKPGEDKKPTWEKSGRIKTKDGADLMVPGQFTFDMGDFTNDGLVDIIVGHGASGIFLYKNVGDAQNPVFAAEEENVIPGAYNFSAYFVDLNGDGKEDLVRGDNWGGFNFYLNKGKDSIVDGAQANGVILMNPQGDPPMLPDGKESLLRGLNGTHTSFADISGDGIIDMVMGGYGTGKVYIGYGVDPNTTMRNLAEIEKIFKAGGANLGAYLDANDKKMLERYKALNAEWVGWARSLPSMAQRQKAYDALKAHIKKFPFLQRQKLNGGAWNKETNKYVPGPMHYVPGIFTQNWVTLHCLLPDSAEHRKDVADTLGLKGLDREQYLKNGLAVADNNACSDGQILSITDFFKYHPRVLFPDDHISIDNNMGDGRDAQSYTFVSNKNTFGSEVGSKSSEWSKDLTDAAEKVLGPGATTGDYFTFVMAHEVCHSLDAYIYSRANQNIVRRWRESMVYAANNGGEVDLIAEDPETGYWDQKATQENFKKAKLWDGKEDFAEAWKRYWESPTKGGAYRHMAFMRGGVDWFLGAIQETMATQANHHWAGSESRLIAAIDRFERGFKSNLNEAVLFLDVLSAGLNELPMYMIDAQKEANRAVFNVQKAILERNDKGYITKVTIGNHVYNFTYNDKGIVTGYTTEGVFEKK